MNCWEYKICDIENRDKCPAYPDRGLDCWKVTGTRCEKGLIEKKNLTEKILYCRECDFFKHYAHKL